MMPDATRINQSQEYILGLLDAIPLTQREIARRIGVSPRQLRYLVAGERPISYPIQFCLESLSVYNTMNAIENLLYDYGFRKDSGVKKGWYLTIRGEAPYGLSPSEQEINRRGGRYYGRDSAAILREVVAESDDFRDFDDDEMSDRMRWEKDWHERASAALREIKAA